MNPLHVLVLSPDSELLASLQAGDGMSANTVWEALSSPLELEQALNRLPEALLVLDLSAPNAPQLLEVLHHQEYMLPLVVVSETTPSLATINDLLRFRVLGFIRRPVHSGKAQAVFREALQRAYGLVRVRSLEQDLKRANQRLNQRLQELNTIYTVGKSVASSLDLDQVLAQIVEVSVNLAQAEEGFILLREGERLFLRAAKNLENQFAQQFNLEASDSVARRVINTGQPAMLRRETKIATGYLARALLYIPLQVPERGVVGILGVVNRMRDQAFTESQMFTLSSIADFAAIAVENARLFSAVQTEQARLRTILERATEAILVVDPENRLLLWSQTAGELFQLSPAAAGQPVEASVKHPRLLELFRQADGGPTTLLAEIEVAEHHIFNAQLTVVPQTGRVVVMQDITSLKELDRLKSEFVSTVSHDLRTPLTTVQGYVALLERVGSLNETQRNFIHRAMESLAHITDLISDLLDIGRIEAGYDLEMHPCRLDEVITQAVQALEPLAQQSEVALRWTPPAQPVWVQGNARRLRQVVDNLVNNAIKYNRSGGFVEVSARFDGTHGIVQVKDNGIGIPLAEQQNLFRRFYRVQTPETEDIRGTGLGLAIVKSVIEKHKGRVWVESTPGKGSTFSFILPALPPPG